MKPDTLSQAWALRAPRSSSLVETGIFRSRLRGSVGSHPLTLHPLIYLVTLLAFGCQEVPSHEQPVDALPTAESPQELNLANEQVTHGRRNAITQAVEAATPAIVSVNVIGIQRLRVQDPLADLFSDPFFGQFFERRRPRVVERQIQNLGSGFLISPDGYIVTNDHVVGSATKITVSLSNGETLDAQLVGTDPSSDLALVKVHAERELPYLDFHAEEEAIVGEWAIALGNPFGLFEAADPTVTVGVVSGTGRHLGQQSGRIYRDMIQTDASINRGNSGGPLLNALGQVIGVNTAIYSESGGSVGLGFAVPAGKAVRILDELRTNGAVDRAYHTGLQVVNVDERIARALEMDAARGILVEAIQPNSPAHSAGIIQYDVIIALHGEAISDQSDYIARLHDYRPGDTLTHTIVRGGMLIELNMQVGRATQ